jgi:NAD-reducing hydrogenase small subunit
MSNSNGNGKINFATIWLDGCAGCHMSFLDMDERLLDVLQRVNVVSSPLVDLKTFPPRIDVALVEGAVSTDEDLHKIRKLRGRTGILITMGDCAITGNIPSMRNAFEVDEVLDRAFFENAALQQQKPATSLPTLLRHARPVHEYVKVDLHVPGCPPPADAIHFVLAELLAGRTPDPSQLTRFGK